MKKSLLLLFAMVFGGAAIAPAQGNEKQSLGKEKPDILFIAIDDLNDWTTLFDKDNPIKTPNLERLAARGALFTRAYCASAGCNPSRTAIMTGLRPTSSGVYDNYHIWREALPDVVTLPQHFAVNGYQTRGAGKIYHHGSTGRDPAGRPSFQEFFKMVKPELRLDSSSCSRWGAVHGKLRDDYTVEWVSERLKSAPRDRPLFMAAGIYHPHLPHFATKAIHDRYPFAEVVQPPMPPEDLRDIPDEGIRMARRQWKGRLFDDPPPPEAPSSLRNLVRGYQASASYADAKVGELLDALDASGRANNMIIILWSDHGYHLGDKQSVVKFTLWEKANHVPFIIVAPGITTPGTRIDKPVGLVNIYPTLVDLAGLPPKPGLDGQSLMPLLKNPKAKWDRPALMTMGRGNHALRTERWRYIRYVDGTEELYDCETDGDWNHHNLMAGERAAAYADTVSKLREWLPQKEAKEGPEEETAKQRFLRNRGDVVRPAEKTKTGDH